LLKETIAKDIKVLFNISALKSIYKTSFREIDNTPTLKEFIKEDMASSEIPKVSDIKSVEERMAKLYAEKEKRAKEDYEKVLYKSPPPLTDEEIQKSRKNIFRNNGYNNR